MFKRIISYKGFWKSVVVLSVVYGLILYIIQWGFKGEWLTFFEAPVLVLITFAVSSFIIGFAMTYGKFWKKLKEQEYRK